MRRGIALIHAEKIARNLPLIAGADIDVEAKVESVDGDQLTIELTASSNGAKVFTRAFATVAARELG